MNKNRVISFALALIIVFKMLDLYIDFGHNAQLHHILQELFLIALSLGLFIYLMIDISRRSQQTKALISELSLSKRTTEMLNKKVLDTKVKFFDAIHAQFDDWVLSPIEKEVALLLIKGLSTAEIASLMQKSEKTVGNQASAIYRKAQVSGRHELAALFFEVLI